MRSDYLIKPVGIPELHEAIIRALRKGQLVREVREVSAETSSLTLALNQLEAVVGEASGATEAIPLAWTTRRYVEQAAAHIARLSLMVGRVVGGLEETSDTSADVCHVMHCQRLVSYQQALGHTVEVLARTKHAFKSKE